MMGKKKKNPDAETIKKINSLLAGHGENIVKHGIAYDNAVTPHYSTEKKRKTVKDVLPYINDSLKGVLKKYLTSAGITGSEASTYLNDLTLNLEQLKSMYKITSDQVFDSYTANEIRGALQRRLREKLKDIIFGEIGNIKDEKTFGDLAERLVRESGNNRYSPEDARSSALDYHSTKEIVNTVYDDLITQHESKARRTKQKSKKGPS
ncbi:hypothetical protein KY358_03355 [Candidatus Woesearchaeota archaeon]|nr:hypothetical protein [Candidatus Woesearchaeota archaeon]